MMPGTFLCLEDLPVLDRVEAHMEALRKGRAPSPLAPMWLHTDISDLLSLSFDSPVLGALRPTCPFIIQLPTCNSFIQQLFIDCLIDTNMFKAFGPVLKELTVDWGTRNGSINICNPRQGEIKYTSQLQKLNALGIHRTVALLVIPKKANYRKNKMNCVTKDSQDSGRVMLAKERGRREQTWRRGSEFGKGRAEVQTLLDSTETCGSRALKARMGSYDCICWAMRHINDLNRNMTQWFLRRIILVVLPGIT